MIAIRKFWAPILLAVSILIFVLDSVWPASSTITDGFAAYYAAARVVLEGRADPVLYDDNLFRLEVERDTLGQASDIYWANPPTTALMFLPIAAFPVTGPIDVVLPGVTGCLSQDLRQAALDALGLNRAAVRAKALDYSWENAARLFLANIEIAQFARLGRRVPHRGKSLRTALS